MKHRSRVFRRLFSELMRLRDLVWSVKSKAAIRGLRLRVEGLEDRVVPAAVLGASMVDTIQIDADSDGKGDPGDTIRYTVTVSNSGDADAINSAFNMNEDTNAPFVAGSVRIGPRAVRDVFNAAGNTQLTGDIRANDVDIDGLTATTSLTITAINGVAGNVGSPVALGQGGSVTVNSNGTFTYTPQTGDENISESFTYSVRDADGLTGTGVVVFNVGALVWYVDSTASSAGKDGSSLHPFTSAADVSGATGPDLANQIIFFKEQAGDYGGMTLLSGQQLYGSGATLTVNTVTINTAGSNTTFANGAGDAITLANGVTVAGISIGTTSGAGIKGTSITNATIDSSVSIANVAGNDLDLSGNATGTINFGASITNTAGRSVSIQNRTGGAVNLTGAISDTGTGILVNSNSGATITFSGALTLNTAANTAFTATGGGTVAATGANSTITTTTGTALNVANTTIGASNLNFKSISAGTAAAGPVNAIILNNTGSSGGLTVTGNGNATVGGDGSGGTIQKTTGDAISLTNTSNVSLTNIVLKDITTDGANGIKGTGVVNFNLARSQLTNIGNSTGPLFSDGVFFGTVSSNNLSGTASITGNLFTTMNRIGMQIQNGIGTLSSLTISNNTINGTVTNAIGVGVEGNAQFPNVQITNNTINANNGLGANGISFQVSPLTATDAPSAAVTISGNNVQNTDGNGILVGVKASVGTLTAKILNNTVAAPLGGTRPGIRVDSGTSAGNTTLALKISGNTSGGSNGSPGIGLRKQGTSTTVNVFGIDGLSPAPASTPAVENYINSLNPGSASGTSGVGGTLLISATSGFTTATVPLIFSPNPASDLPPVSAPLPVATPAASAGESNVVSPPAATLALTQASTAALVAAAIDRWEAAGLTPAQDALLHSVTIDFADLPGMYLGQASPGHITLDHDAAGHGWFVDPTAADNGEFPVAESSTRLEGGPEDRLDLLTTILHEMGHQLGLADRYDLAGRDDLMYGYLVLGERRLPAFGEAAGADSNMLAGASGPDFLVGPVALGNVPFGGSVQLRFDTQVIGTPTGASLTNQGTVTANGPISVLTDDPSVGGLTDPNVTPLDRPDVTLAISAASANENSGTDLVYTFTRLGSTTGALTANFTVGGTATFNTDYTQSGAASFTATTGTVTFAAGSATATVTIHLTGDTVVEDNETVVLTVVAGTGYNAPGDPGYASGHVGTQTGTISNDDTATLTLSGGIAKNEGNSGTVSYTFTATLSNAVQGGFKVAYTTNDGTATAGSDYTDNDGTLTFTGTANEQKTITVLVNGDNTVELDEAFTVALGAISNTTPVQVAAITEPGSPQTGTITNDDVATVSLAGNVSQSEATTPQVFTVNLSNPVDVNVTVKFSTSDSTATAGSDYTAVTNQTVTFLAGTTTAQVVNVTVANDTVVEANEVFNVGLATLAAGGRNVSLGTSTGTGTISNDDSATLTLSGGIAQNEGQSGTTSYTFTATLNKAVQGGFDVAYTTNDGTATAGSDYTDNDSTLHFNGTVGETKTITVLVNGDTTIEPDETFTVALGTISASTPVQIAAITEAGSPQTGTITTDDTDVSVAVAPTSVTEDGSTNLVYTFTRAGITSNSLTVNFTVGGAATFSTDYTQSGAASFNATSGTVTFAPGSTTATITVDPTADTTSEPDEGVILTLASGAGYRVVPGSDVATGTILDDDVKVTVTASPSSVAENSGTPIVYTFTRTGDLSLAATVNFSYAGTASDASDYTQSGAATFASGVGTVTFAAGSATATVTLTPTADAIVEDDETAILTVTTGTGYGIGTPAAATGTMSNDDFATVTLSGGIAKNEGNSGTVSYTFTATLDKAVQGGFDVAYTTNDGTATAGSDYTDNDSTLHFNGTVGESKTITVFVNGDNTVELTEDFTVALGAFSNTSGTQVLALSKSGSPQTGTITNDDSATVSLAGNVSQLEATTPQVFTVNLSNPVDVNVTVKFSTSDSTATAGSDYTAVTNQTVTFLAGTTTAQVVNVTVNNDDVVEDDEVFNVGIGTLAASGRNVSLGTTTTGTGTISNNDAATVTLSGGIAQNEGNSGTVSYTFTATLNNAVQGGFKVAYTTNDGTATAGSDYTDNDGTLTFAGNAGETKTITVLVNGDNTVELDEAFTVALGAISNTTPVQLAQLSTTGSPQTGTITNDDSATVSLAGNVSQSEATTPQVFTVNLSNPVDVPVTVVFNTSDGTATAGSDYTAVTNQTVTFLAGTTTAQVVNVTVNNDAVAEDDEVFNVGIGTLAASGRNVTLGTSTGTGTITNDDAATVTLSGGIAQNEGNSGTTSYTFTATLNNAVQGGFKVAYTTNDGTATAGSDYTDNDGTLTFAGNAGESKTITVLVNGDNTVELDEAFTVALGAISNTTPVQLAQLSTTGSPQTGTITNDDSATVSLAGNVSQSEATTPQVFTVNLSNPVDVPVTVVFNTSDGTATAGSDYTAVTNQTVTFLAGTTTAQVVNVTVNNDAVAEDDEVFNVGIGTLAASGRNVTLGTSTGTGTITNDDAATVTLSGGIAQNEGNSGTTSYTFTATLNNAVQGGFKVAYTTNDGTATAGSDYTDNDGTLTFAGNAGESKTITVLVNGDNTVELDEAFTVALGAISNTTPVQLAQLSTAGSPQTGTITNDDSATVSIQSNVSQSEATSPQAFTVTLSNPVDVTVTVPFSTSDGTAVAGSDYTGITNQVVTFTAGSTTGQIVNVTVANDAVVEDDEVFNVGLGTVSATGRNVSLGTSTGTGTITNDDSATLTLTGGSAQNEGVSGTTAYTFTVTLNKAVQGGFDVAYTTNDGTATAPSDYTDNDGTLHFNGTVGETKTITVLVNGDTTSEPDETFTVALGTISNATAVQIAAISEAGSPQTGTITNDDIPPDTAIGTKPGAVTASTSATFTFTGSNNVAPGPLTFEGSLDSAPFTAITSPITFPGLADGSHTFQVRAVNSYGNADPTPASYTWIVDTAAPTASFSAPSATLTASSPVTYTLTVNDVSFNSASLTASDFTLNKTGTANGTLQISGSGNTRTVTITGITGNGTLGVTLKANSITDALGNTNASAVVATPFNVDNTKPAVSISAPSVATVSMGSVSFTVTYSDTNLGAITLSASDVTLNTTGMASATTVGVSGSGNTRTVTISGISGDGTLGISIAANTAMDGAGNLAVSAGPSSTVVVDNSGPAVSISGPTAVSSSSISYTVTYTDPNLAVITLSASDVTLNKTGTATGTVGVSGSGNTRTVTITGITGDGTLSISIAANTATDTFSHPAPAAGPSAIYTVKPTQRYDMKSSSSAPPVAGWNKVWQGTAYSATTGFGWASTSTIGGGTGGQVPSPLPPGGDANVLGDYSYSATAATFRVFVGVGKSATVTIYSYATATQGQPGLTASVGSGPASTLSSNGILTVSGTAGADGVLQINFGVRAGATFWVVNALEVTPV